MQIYFVKATYTNNVYKIGDFFTGTAFKLVAGKMLDINFKPDDGLTSFITKNITLPDTTSVRDHTHIIIPSFTKIYRIASIDYMNNDQYMIMLDEDPLIGNYQELLNTYLILQRSNDPSLWRGVNDIADMTLKETVETTMITSVSKTGKWALLFFQYSPDADVVGLKFEKSFLDFEAFTDLTALTTKYPEVNTTQPELYDYFQKKVKVGITDTYQCVYDGSGAYDRLRWCNYVDIDYEVYYAKLYGSKVNEGEVMTAILALPFETDLVSDGVDDDEILSYDRFFGVTTTNLIDIKIVNDLVFKIDSVAYSLSTRTMVKTLALTFGYWWWKYAYQEVGLITVSDKVVLTVTRFATDINITPSYSSTPTDEPKSGEPFNKYDLYIFGKKFTIPYFLIDNIRMMISINSGVINFLIYTVDKRNVLGSGSFTHSIKYAIDQLDAFYSQNPTYKDQFFTQMGVNAVKNVAGGTIGGFALGGPVGALIGSGAGLVSAGVDAGLSYMNFKFQEKSLRLKPDQVFGETSEISLQIVNIFGIYWVKRTSSNIDLMLSEYELRGFPTSVIKRISDLAYQAGTLFSSGKIVYGELKNVVKNEYATQFINQKLKEGLVFIP